MIEYTKAARENTFLLIAFAGGTGSGKTYSAMQLASGICGDEPFIMIDTEARRGLHYADKFDFEHVDFQGPFSPDRYTAAIDQATKRGFKAVVIDSMSHEWEGEGGILEMAEKETAKPPKNWVRPKLAHKKMMASLLQARTNLIFCLRAQEKLYMDTDKRGKLIVENAGWMPICEKRFMFEMTASLTFDHENPGVVTRALPHKIEEQHHAAFPSGKAITRNSGLLLNRWASGKSIVPLDLEEKAREEAKKGSGHMKAWWNTLSRQEKIDLKPIAAELKDIAQMS